MPQKIIYRILRLAGKYKSRIQLAFVFAVLKAITSKLPIVLAFYVLKEFYEDSLTGKDCLRVGIALGIIVVLQALFQYICDRLQSSAGFMIFADKRIELGNHLRKMPMGYFTEGNIGKISSVLSTDMIFIEEVSMTAIAEMMSAVLTAAILNIFMFVFDVKLGLLTAAVTVTAALIASKMNKVSNSQAQIKQEQSQNLTEEVLSYIEGIEVIKSYNLTDEKSRELTNAFCASKDKAIEFEESMKGWTLGLNLLYGAGMTAVFGLSVYQQQTGAMTTAYLIGILLFVFDLFGPLKMLFGEFTRFTVMNSCLDRIEEVLNEKELSDKGKELIPNDKNANCEIQFNHVTFGYQEEAVIHDISFKMKKNTMTAVVGPSGGGKSTIANLIARFWDVDGGSIQIRGKDIRQVPLFDLMKHISMVFQRVYLFQDTIYNNISMGKEGTTKEEVYEAAKKARCYEFIMQLPDGFETVIGEGGATLSGGEKQRISIARCILKDAPIVILDEATASVDADNESYIQEAISELVKGKTLLVIAHRLNTIQSADQILVVENGNIVQSGNHEKLLGEKGIYQNFLNIRKSTH